MLTRHALNTHVGPDDHHGVVGNTARHAVDGGFDVFFVPGEVDEGDHLGAPLADAHPVQVPVLGLVHDGAGAVEAQDVVAHRAGPPGLCLVLVSEEKL